MGGEDATGRSHAPRCGGRHAHHRPAGPRGGQRGLPAEAAGANRWPPVARARSRGRPAHPRRATITARYGHRPAGGGGAEEPQRAAGAADTRKGRHCYSPPGARKHGERGADEGGPRGSGRGRERRGKGGTDSRGEGRHKRAKPAGGDEAAAERAGGPPLASAGGARAEAGRLSRCRPTSGDWHSKFRNSMTSSAILY